jgi:hypothetical protein
MRPGHSQTDSTRMNILKNIHIDTTGSFPVTGTPAALTDTLIKRSSSDSITGMKNLQKLIQAPGTGDSSKGPTPALKTSSLENAVQIPGNPLSSTGDLKNTLLTKKDSIKPSLQKNIVTVKAGLKNVQPHGYISAGYEYGVLPFVTGDRYPSGGFRTEGDVSLLLAGVPLKVNYYYTSIKNVIGLNNYFRVSFDTERYKDQLSEKLSTKDELSKLQLEKMQAGQQELLKKSEYLNYLQKFPHYRPPAEKKTGALTDSLSFQGAGVSIPSQPAAPGYTVPAYNAGVDSTEYLAKKDSISYELAKYKKLYDSTANEIALLKKQIAQAEEYQNHPPAYSNPYLSKAQQLLSGIKKFEIGLCHPSYSTFLVSNIPVQGINLEYSRNNNFIAFTYGTTISNLLFNTSSVQSTIETGRNLYNYFDFSNLDGGRKILCLKGGFGNKEETHLYAGLLLGKGRTDYLTFSSADHGSADYSTESNAVLELDARYLFSEKLSADLIIGKSSLKEEDLTMSSVSRSMDEIFSAYRSNAILARINTSIERTKTKLTFTTRWIDPYFKSFGTGFMRSDNLRYEIKADQPLGKKVKYTVAYRREEDNLLKLYNYKNTLQSISNMLNLKLNRQINIRLIYTPLFRELKSERLIIKDRNDISTVIVSYTPRPKKIISQFNGLYSRYIITGDSADINFENITYSHQLQARSGFKTGLNVSWFRNNLSDTLGNDMYLSVADIGYQGKKGSSITVGGKCAVKKNMIPQYGFLIRTRIKVYKGLSWEAEGEKILVGDYYNSFIISKISGFPYYLSTKLTLNF